MLPFKHTSELEIEFFHQLVSVTIYVCYINLYQRHAEKFKKKNEISIWSRAHLWRGFGASHTTILLLLGKNVGSFQLQVDQLEFTSIKRLFLFGLTFMTVLVALMAKGATYKCVVNKKKYVGYFQKTCKHLVTFLNLCGVKQNHRFLFLLFVSVQFSSVKYFRFNSRYYCCC